MRRSVPYERRTHVRKPVDLPVSFQVAGTERQIDARMSDLSAGGALVTTAEKVPFGANVSITMTLPPSKPITVAGVIRWTKPDSMGVQFGQLGARETYAITEYLSKLPRPSVT
jgi:type IV pilus assembly protein PilZ